jgi:lysophospholipase L1-like esterase
LRGAYITGSLLLLYLGAELALVTPRTHLRAVAPGEHRSSVALDCYPTNPRGYFDLDLREPLTRKRYEQLGVPGLNDLAAQAPFCVELRYNSEGFRDRIPAPRRTSIRRVVVVGDSFTEGQGVRGSDVYPRVLEAQLNATGKDGWEVLNFGRRGADFPGLAGMFEQALGLEPDVVVYGMALNDCELSPSFRARQPLLSERLRGHARPDAPASRRPFGLRSIAFLPRQWEMFRVNWGMAEWYRHLYGQQNRDGWRRTQAILQETDLRLRSRGAHFLISVWPVLVSLGGGYPLEQVHEAIEAFCRGAGIACLDLLPALQGRSSVSLWVHPVDTHPNELAHRLAAADLARAVRHLIEEGHR